MSNTFLGFTNLAEAGTLKNGTGGGSIPLLDEVSPYAMTNAMNSDRYSLWQTALANAPVVIDIDLGANRTVTTAAVLGIRVAAGAALTNLKVYSATAAVGYYPAAWTLQGTLNYSASSRDCGVVFASASARYWRFEFTISGGAFTLGHVWLGNPTDLGGIHSPGGTFSPSRTRLETPLPSGAIALRDLGDPGADFVLPWNTITSTVRDSLLLAADEAGSFLLVDADGDFYEVFAPGGRVDTARNSTSLFSANLVLKRMP